jgi:hypothetical protein
MKVEYTKGERASKELIMLHREASEATSGRKRKVSFMSDVGRSHAQVLGCNVLIAIGTASR